MLQIEIHLTLIDMGECEKKIIMMMLVSVVFLTTINYLIYDETNS